MTTMQARQPASLLSVFLFILVSFSAFAQERHILYKGLYANEAEGIHGLYNPERGFRLEVATDIVGKGYFWNPTNYPVSTAYLDKETQYYASDSISLVQSYIYLTKAVGRELSEDDFQTMTAYFDRLRALGQKAVLRFAYESEGFSRAAIGPTPEDIFRHTTQLKPFLEENKDVICVVQAGLIGAWGEWHSSVYGLEQSKEIKKAVLEAALDMTPAGRMLQVRLPEYKNLIKRSSPDWNRLSYHDDFIVIHPHPWDGGLSEDSKAFRQIVKESPYLLIDGELPWGSWSMSQDPDNSDSGWIVDGREAARRFFLQHYTSLSIIHNYKENGAKDKYSMMYWKETPITQDFLIANHMPFSPAYFQTKEGETVERTAFDYIRDHLGYRIELQELTIRPRPDDSSLEIELSLINRGFSTLFNEHPIYFVLIDPQGQVVYTQPTDANVNEWQPYKPGDKNHRPLLHSLSSEFHLPEDLSPGTYSLGLWIPDGSSRLMYNHRYAIRCANSNAPWWISADQRYGINILTTLIR